MSSSTLPPASPAPAPAEQSASRSGDDSHRVTIERLFAVLGNVTLVTALLVYFGWRRSETHARLLGIDESILGMSTRDYVLRSVGPVLALLVVVAAAGLLWLWLDGHIAAWARQRGPGDGVVRIVLLGLSGAWIVLPAIAYLLGFIWRREAYVAFPLTFAAGVLLMLYGRRLGHALSSEGDPARESILARTFAATLVAVCLFWAASNYAQVLGSSLAREFAGDIDRLTGVVVYSPNRLHIEAPDTVEESLGGDESAFRYRYLGLRLLDHTGGHYFLVSDGWTPQYGVVVLLDDGDDIRLEFVRDRR